MLIPNPAFALRRLLFAALCGVASPATVASADMSKEFQAQRQARLAALFEDLANSESDIGAYAVERRIWKEWFNHDDAETRGLMGMAMEARAARDFDRAEMLLSGILGLSPDYAEAWNQRATIRYMASDFDGSLEDIAQTLAREPRHFGALAGKSTILAAREDYHGALQALEQAIAIHPYLRGRVMMRGLRKRIAESDGAPAADDASDAELDEAAQ